MFRAPPSGMVDRLFDAAQRLREVEGTLMDLLLKAGFQELIVPLVERAEVFSSERALRFVDRHGEVLGLRADFTGPVARVVSTRLRGQQEVRLCYRGVVFRDADERSGARRQLHQAGYELFDGGGADSDAETIRLALRIGDALSLRDLRVSIGSAELIHALCPDAGPEVRLALDRRDPSGLPPSLLPLLGYSGDASVLQRAQRELPPAARPALQRLQQVLETLGADAARAELDLAEVRPWAYYTGIVFNLFAQGFGGAVAGGGRYDGLAGRYGSPRKAIGASIDIDAVTDWTADREGATDLAPLTVALPKGRIQKAALARLGLLGPSPADLESRKLMVPGQSPLGSGPLAFLLVKDADIPAYVERGAADLGIVGRDVLEESPADVLQPLVTDMGRCRMCLCGRPGTRIEDIAAKGSLRVATKYPLIARRALEARGIPAEIIPLQGSVELSVPAGLADAIVDMVETGATLRANGLVELEDLLESTARVVVNRGAWRLKNREVRELIDRLAGDAEQAGRSTCASSS